MTSLKTLFITIIIYCLFLYNFANNSISRSYLPIDPISKSKYLKIDSLLKILNKKHQFNGVVLVAEGSEIIYNKAYGYKNKKDTLTSKTVFHIASISKCFTSLAILILAENNKLSLDDKLTKYFPELLYKEIKIKHLLQHTSGLPEINDFSFINQNEWTKPFSNELILKLYLNQKNDVSTKPGEKFKYSNAAFNFLAMIIEKVSGQSYDDFVKENIFSKINMNNTFCYKNDSADIAESIKLKKFINKCKSFGKDNFSVTRGDNNICTTTEDLFKFDQALYTDKLISGNLLKEVFKQGILNDGSKTRYGYGWIVDKDNEIVFHRGNYMNYTCIFIRYLKEKKTIIYLSNIHSKTFYYTILEIDKIINGKILLNNFSYN